MQTLKTKNRMRDTIAPIVFWLSLLFWSSGTYAQTIGLPEDDTTISDAQSELEQIQNSITLKRELSEKLKLEIDAMDDDRAQQNAALIAAAQRVKLAEIEVGAMEERLNELQKSEFEVRTRLQGSDIAVASLLSALQRISLTPPPALIVNPSDALSSARGAILLSEALPQLTDEAKQVSEDLLKLEIIKSDAIEEAEALKTNFSALYEDQLRIATLIEARKRGVARTSEILDAQEKEAEELATRATSLSQLIKVLNSRLSALGTNEPVQPPTTETQLTTAAIQQALAKTDRTSPAFAFENAKGYLARAASGVNVIDYGSSDGFGGISKGLSVVTRADATVVAPADAWVIYKGPYLNYGQIVILNTGQDHSIVLAGLAQVDVELGQFILRGEPVGKMGSRTIGQTVTTSAGVSRPTLYIELRDLNGPIDPTGWWASEDEQTKSG